MKMTGFEKVFILSPLRVFLKRKYEAARVLSNLGISEGGVCLEIGSGQGAGALLINQYLKCRRVAGVDIDPDMIEAARKYIAHPPRWARNIRTDNIEFVNSDAVKLPFENAYFDAVVHFAVLDHIAEWRKVISEIYRVLKPGGICSFDDFLLPASPVNRLFGHISIKEAELKEALKNTGFTIRSFERGRLHICFVRAVKEG